MSWLAAGPSFAGRSAGSAQQRDSIRKTRIKSKRLLCTISYGWVRWYVAVSGDCDFSGFSIPDNTRHKLDDVTAAYSQQRPLTILLAWRSMERKIQRKTSLDKVTEWAQLSMLFSQLIFRAETSCKDLNRGRKKSTFQSYFKKKGKAHYWSHVITSLPSHALTALVESLITNFVPDICKGHSVWVELGVCVYLDGLLLLENRCEVRQDETNILLLGTLFGYQQHVGKHKGNHVGVDELRGQWWQDAIHHHSLWERKSEWIFACPWVH